VTRRGRGEAEEEVAANHPPRVRTDEHVSRQQPSKNPRERAILLAVTKSIAPKALGGVGASRGEVRITKAVEAHAVEIYRDQRGRR
jgi:hypothetical protein